MAKKFNITGNCVSRLHYMADTTAKMKAILDLVESGEYFTINRPRQYGKTTTLYRIFALLRERPDYLAFPISFEGVGDASFTDEKRFSQMFLELLEERMTFFGEVKSAKLLKKWSKQNLELKQVGLAITELAKLTKKKLVLLIDEVDKSSNNQLFVSFLAMLRNKYLAQMEGVDTSFYSVILVGVHDVKTLKMKLNPDAERKLNSPWNIAADFKVDMNLNPHEIIPMLQEYASDKEVKMDFQAIAERLFYYTSGYPFLVSKLCKMLDEDGIPLVKQGEWHPEDVLTAFNILIQEKNTNFDSLVKNLEDNQPLYDLTQQVILNNDSIPFNAHNSTIELGIVYGIFAPKSGNDDRLKIHNRVYRELLANYMSIKTLIGMYTRGATFQGRYLLEDNKLDIEKMLRAFQEFMQEEYSKKEVNFIEREGRLIFLAFLKPILNGGGFAFKEPQISEEKRLDVVISFFTHKYLIELKLWYGEAAHEKGLIQLADYLDRQHLDTGFLLIFDRSRQHLNRGEWLTLRDKKVFVAWV
jgi:AAA-like domain